LDIEWRSSRKLGEHRLGWWNTAKLREAHGLSRDDCEGSASRRKKLNNRLGSREPERKATLYEPVLGACNILGPELEDRWRSGIPEKKSSVSKRWWCEGVELARHDGSEHPGELQERSPRKAIESPGRHATLDQGQTWSSRPRNNATERVEAAGGHLKIENGHRGVCCRRGFCCIVDD
jgi:hypothetical protein